MQKFERLRRRIPTCALGAVVVAFGLAACTGNYATDETRAEQSAERLARAVAANEGGGAVAVERGSAAAVARISDTFAVVVEPVFGLPAQTGLGISQAVAQQLGTPERAGATRPNEVWTLAAIGSTVTRGSEAAELLIDWRLTDAAGEEKDALLTRQSLTNGAVAASAVAEPVVAHLKRQERLAQAGALGRLRADYTPLETRADIASTVAALASEEQSQSAPKRAADLAPNARVATEPSIAPSTDLAQTATPSDTLTTGSTPAAGGARAPLSVAAKPEGIVADAAPSSEVADELQTASISAPDVRSDASVDRVATVEAPQTVGQNITLDQRSAQSASVTNEAAETPSLPTPTDARNPVQQAVLAPAATKPAPPASPASASNRDFRIRSPVFIGDVTGAPGDGNNALGRAIRAQLVAANARISADQGPEVYRIGATVTRENLADADQITIVWRVARNGEQLGDVTQKNSVASGSLDGAWGRQAALAAQGARAGILHLIANDPTRE